MAEVAIITGSAGLIGGETVRFFSEKGFTCVGIDNNMRSYFFGEEASTLKNREEIESKFTSYIHRDVDIRNSDELAAVFKEFSTDIKLVVHTAAQPSHDWAAKEPFTDFTVNANGTLNLLENTRLHCPEATFIFTSTNKVYGDTPNDLPLVEIDSRWEVNSSHKFAEYGIDESMSIDQCKHSLFGASKVAADVLVQEYGRYFGMNTASFRGGCLTGPTHCGAELHGFLAYLMKCAISGKQYKIFGYKGKQVRDNIHSFDLVNAFYHFHRNPRKGEVYNIGGSRHSNCSMKEAIEKCERLSGKSMNVSYMDENRIGDHIWYISDVRKFQKHYPEWSYRYNIDDIFSQIYEANTKA
ncbi:MAG: NAD-dependent epimerase/dehydratase family protein [Lentisphaeraceae bacterium]|nr:NAD-dependent epimerase/dehydratase family protein [Lentisphaeraceae bacterium]